MQQNALYPCSKGAHAYRNCLLLCESSCSYMLPRYTIKNSSLCPMNLQRKKILLFQTPFPNLVVWPADKYLRDHLGIEKRFTRCGSTYLVQIAKLTRMLMIFQTEVWQTFKGPRSKCFGLYRQVIQSLSELLSFAIDNTSFQSIRLNSSENSFTKIGHNCSW